MVAEFRKAKNSRIYLSGIQETGEGNNNYLLFYTFGPDPIRGL